MRTPTMILLAALLGAPPAHANGAAPQPLPSYLGHLAKVNPNLSRILHDNPGVAKYLENMSKRGALFEGHLQAGESPTRLSWEMWNHSEQTNATWHHNMKDDTILNKDVVIVWQKGDGSTSFNLGYHQPQGKIIGVYQLRDLVNHNTRWGDGGFVAHMNVEGAGQPGHKDVMAWAVVNIDPNGVVRGGGYPDMQGGSPVPYQQLERERRAPSGHQYPGRAAEVVHSTTTHLPAAFEGQWTH
jgi:hypothetical protein